ncbi:DUF3017 domain-containing protein [Amycolatopsis samaneae]|uniref:DUF3017 domain-containing protein n=1 Tax=Amycolatopsis samaneae TaxID=664691 RepID=A0ABW5GF29_9PSEU
MTVAGHRSDRRALREQLPFALVLLVVAVAALRIFQYHWREGAVLIGGALLLAGLLRAILPAPKAGLLAIRGKPVDVLTYTALSVLILFVAFTIVGGPFGGSS